MSQGLEVASSTRHTEWITPSWPGDSGSPVPGSASARAIRHKLTEIGAPVPELTQKALTSDAIAYWQAYSARADFPTPPRPLNTSAAAAGRVLA